MNTLPAGPRRILLVSHYYPPHVGGIEGVARAEAERLAALGYEVAVLTSADRGSVRSEGGVRVVRVAAWNGFERRMGVPFPIFSPRILVRALRLARWAHVIHMHDCFYISSWSAGIAAVLLRRPMVLTQHVGLVNHPSRAVAALQKLVYGVFGRPLVRRARTVFVVNDSVGRFVRGLGAEAVKVVVVPNGVDDQRFRPAADPAERERLRKEHGLPADRSLALFAGRLVPKKGIDIALAALSAHGAEFDLVVIGAGDTSVLDGHASVRFLGSLPPDQVAELYRACDVLVLPNTGEIFPLVIQEAMSAGIPIVTTAEPDYVAIGADRLGIALVPREATAVGAAIREILADGRLRARMGESSRAYALEQFSWTEHLAVLRERYAAAMGGP